MAMTSGVPHDHKTCPYVKTYGSCIYNIMTGVHNPPTNFVVITESQVALDGLMDVFRKRNERNKEKYKAFERDYCQEFDDVMDGFVIHASTCPNYQDMAVSDNRCINLTLIRGSWPKGLAEVR